MVLRIRPEPPVALCVSCCRFHNHKAALTMATNFFQQQDLGSAQLGAEQSSSGTVA